MGCVSAPTERAVSLTLSVSDNVLPVVVNVPVAVTRRTNPGSQR